MFPGPYQSSIERHAVAAFVDAIDADGVVVDVGCGLGHVTDDLARRGLDVLGCDPSPAMLAIARDSHPHVQFVDDDATLTRIESPIAAIIARFSLIHIAPDQLVEVIRSWADRLRAGTPVLIAAQSSDIPGRAMSFDHAVAPAWRWHPDELARVLTEAGFDEEWRIVNRPDGVHRFPAVHLLARRRDALTRPG
jgi:SAM-dependent methyltransferase